MDNAKIKNHTVSSLNMDVEGIFDNVFSRPGLNTLTEKHIPPQHRRGVETILSTTTATMSLDGQTEEMSTMLTAMPQGSPVTPILFLPYLSPLLDIIEKQYPITTCPSYLDNVGLLVAGRSEASNCGKLKNMASTAIGWGVEEALVFDNPKTEFMQKNGGHIRIRQSTNARRHCHRCCQRFRLADW